MPEIFRTEFTGERVIPGQVEDNLFNEHLARYRFSVRLWSGGGRILDAGCGAGYGSRELASSGADVLGIDVSEEAIGHARASYAGSGVRFEQASCTAIPAEDGAFGMITAFEVIEHLEDWRGFLREAFRVLAGAGLFLVSTPNRLYYAESRQKAGPNPFHVHEFTESEFRSELSQVFPHVKVLLQNHVEGIALSGSETEGTAIEIGDRKADPDGANFFLAVCGKQRLPALASFVFIPQSGNVLQTRERHIALLEGEIGKKNGWIEQEKVERRRMLDKVSAMETELEEHNRWAQQANAEAERRAQLVASLQEELRKSNEWAQLRDAEALQRGQVIAGLQEELRKSNAWALARDAEAVERGQVIVGLQEELQKSNAWARARDAEAVERGQVIGDLQEELRKSNEWALARDAEAVDRGRRVEQLQEEVAQATAWAKERDAEVEKQGDRFKAEMAAASAGYEAAIAEWQRAKEGADQWAMETERRLSAERDAAREAFAAKETELEMCLERLAAAQAEAEQMRAQLAEVVSRMDMIAKSRWVRLGRVAGIGPEIHRS